MAFKSMDDYNNTRYGGMFILQNDGDYADVIFMYRNRHDVLVADTHYIKSNDYTGYVHCCGRGCPACAKGIRVQSKLFIPMYVINEDKVLFFDRNIRFDAQLNNDVFSRYPNPSEYVFRITRHGESGDVNTRYEIMAVGRNTILSYDEILAKLGISMPDYYSTVCREYSSSELTSMLSVNASGSGYNSEMPEYKVSARKQVDTSMEDLFPKVLTDELPESATPVNSWPDVSNVVDDISDIGEYVQFDGLDVSDDSEVDEVDF